MSPNAYENNKRKTEILPVHTPRKHILDTLMLTRKINSEKGRGRQKTAFRDGLMPSTQGASTQLILAKKERDMVADVCKRLGT